MSDIKKYRVKVIEKYSDVVIVDAKNRKEAMDKAVEIAEVSFECLYDCEVSEVQDGH